MNHRTGLRVASLAPFPDIEALHQMLVAHDADVEVVSTPYDEGLAFRNARGANLGRLPVDMHAPEISDEHRAVWERTDALLALDVPDNIAELFPQLRWLQLLSVGHEQLDHARLAAHGVQVTMGAGIAAASISEFVMGRLLQIWKQFRLIDEHQAEHRWVTTFGGEVAGKTLCIVGLGAIGRAVAVRARAFGMHLIATRASAAAGDTDPDVDELHPADMLLQLAPRCDALVAALPANPAVDGLFDGEFFDAMRHDAVFCNVGRGMHVVEADLIAALDRGGLRAAVLDVARTEPLPADDPLWAADNLYLSPHCSVSLDRYSINTYTLMADNFARFVQGKPLRNEVSLER